MDSSVAENLVIYGKGSVASAKSANYSLVVVYNFDFSPLTFGSSVSCDAPVFKYLGTDHTVELPDTSTRVAPLTQSINNYNNTDNSSKYFIVPLSYLDSLADLNLGLDPSFCYSPGVYDEETKIFTEPVTGAQYLTTGWVYDYNTRTYACFRFLLLIQSALLVRCRKTPLSM